MLLIALTETNADIQKIVAFEGAFEKILDIVMEENATDGDIIVQDCLQLCHNLLRYNVSNQVRINKYSIDHFNFHVNSLTCSPH